MRAAPRFAPTATRTHSQLGSAAHASRSFVNGVESGSKEMIRPRCPDSRRRFANSPSFAPTSRTTSTFAAAAAPARSSTLRKPEVVPIGREPCGSAALVAADEELVRCQGNDVDVAAGLEMLPECGVLAGVVLDEYRDRLPARQVEAP